MDITGTSTVWKHEHTRHFFAFLAGIVVVFLFFSIYSFINADTGVIRPDGNGTILGTPTGCTSNLNYECLNEVITQPTSPSTGSDFVTIVNTNADNYLLQSIGDVNTATTITIWYYHSEGGTNAQQTIGLFAADEATQYGTTQLVTTRTSAQWDSVTISGLTLTQAQLDGLRVRVSCTKIGGGGSNTCVGYALYADVTYTKQIEVNVGTTGTQQNLDVGITSAHIGGSFSITELIGSRNVTSITIEETGTVNAQTNLDNIELWYDIDNVAPYDCASVAYDGNETQFGVTDTDGFSGANGTSVFTGSVGITTTAAMCVYTVLDVLHGAVAAQTIEVQITNPSTQVVASGGGDVEPITPVLLAGQTILQASKLDQIHYHWRNDDGSEAGATSATGGIDDTTYDTLGKLSPARLRMEVSNEGNKTTSEQVEIIDPFVASALPTLGTSVTVSSGDKRLLLVAIHSEDSSTNVDVNTVTYGGQTLIEVTDQQITTSFSNGMWVGYLDEAGITAAVGTTLLATWNGLPDTVVEYNAVVFQHVDQTDPVPAWSGNTGTITATLQPTTTIAVAAGDTAVYFTNGNTAGFTSTPDTGYTEGTDGGAGLAVANAYKNITASGTEQPTATWSSAHSRMIVVALNIQSSLRFKVEYARKITTCSAATGWSDVAAVGGDWDMFDSVNLTEGGNTTDIAEGIGGVLNENTTFLTPNGGVRDITSVTGDLTLTASNFVELEYSLVSTAASTEGYTYCFRTTNDGAPLDVYSAYPEATILADITVTSAGTQTATVDIPTNNVYAGADFIFTDNIAGDTTINSITLSASGTVDYDNDIDNLVLLYDLDTTSPYNCVSENYDGNETQFGATSTTGFSAAATSTFTGSQIINTTQTLCLYTKYDVSSAVSNDETLDIKIGNASNDVFLSSGSAAPAALVDLVGVTTFVTTATVQDHYHWRNDNGNETGASSATGDEDTVLENLRPTVPKRLRIGVSNQGSASTPARQYRLEYALKVATCAGATGWTDVGAAGGEFDMFNSTNITEGGSTTNIATTTGGVTDVGDTYLVVNGGLRDITSQTGAITLPGKNFVDLEYSLTASTSATQGATYCLRVTDAGTVIDSYNTYPEVSIKAKTDFFIQRGVSTISGTSLSLTAGTEYIAPAASTTAFIRITNTLNSGAGGGAAGNADDVTVYISNPSNILNGITFTRPATATGDTRVAWEIIEYVGAPGGNNEIIVRQQQTATYGTAATTVTTAAAAGVVTDADIAVFVTGQLNPDTLANYPYGNSTAAWNAGTDTTTFTRGATGNAAGVSYAVVEFIGSNWKVQRSEHTYTAVATAETEAITAVNSLSRTFVHSQKRMTTGLNTHGDYGHQVWLSGIGQVSYLLDGTAGTPAGHTSVAWVIENTQTIGTVMNVTRSNGTQSGGASPATINVNIGKTLSDTQDSSLFINNTGNETGGGGGTNSFPEPMLSARIISETQYELWIADTSDTRSWRTEIVEWPTAARDIDQNYYRFYVNNGLLDPADPWPAGVTDIGENTEITVLDSPVAVGEIMRLRMTLQISSAGMEPGLDSFKLQYGERLTTCTAIGEVDWHDVGGIGSTTALWRGATTALTDGTNLSVEPPTAGDLNISVSDVAGTFEEENNSAFTPFVVDPGEDVEFDWAIENNIAKEKTSYCFRMTESSKKLFDLYNFYPTMRTAGYTPTLNQWRFYDDETNITPIAPLAAENTAPIDIANGNLIKLRTTVQESTGGEGTDIKFKIQFSESSDFSQGVFDVVSSTTCALNATTTSDLWCYADAAGVDNAVINSAVLSDANTCSGGVGAGCGTHNEGVSTTTATFDQPPYSITEYEFTLAHAGARANAVYYFRLYDINNEAVVAASSSLPSLVTEGAGLTFTVDGLGAGTTVGAIVTDATTTATSILFDSIPFDTEHTAAHRLTVDTNATEGYQILVFSDQLLTNTYGSTIPEVTGSNATPLSWMTGCVVPSLGCFGYHTTDSSLLGGDPRFGAEDTYAAFSTTPQEVMYRSTPILESHDIVYKIQIGPEQPSGDYQKTITYLAIPVF